MNNPKVSIIMGIYNCEVLLPIAIESVIAQTYNNWELIMCDDGSTDKTYEVAWEYAEQFPSQIILLRNHKNMRLAASLNKCIAVATGEYIARMDADDACMPERLELQVDFLNSHPSITCVGTGMKIFDENGVHGERYYEEYPDRMTMIHRTPFPHPTIMIRRKELIDIGCYTVSADTMRAEDIDLWFRFYFNGYNGYVIQKPLYQYRESINDFSKRSLKAAIGTSKVYLKGYKLLDYPFYVYPFALKPIISALIPNRCMQFYHRMQDKTKARVIKKYE